MIAKRLRAFSGEFAVALLRVSNVAVSPIAALAISSRLSPEEQGYYFSFISILMARYLFEAGVGQVIVATAAQERTGLEIDRRRGVVGPPKSLSAISDVLRFSNIWYGAASLVLLAVVGTAGFAFFDTGRQTAVNWSGPWILYVIVGAVDFALLGFWSTLEGLNQIVPIYLLRAAKTVASVAALAGIVFAGGHLWCVVGFQIVAVVADVVFVALWRRVFFDLYRQPGGILDWKKNVWPFQWRMAVSWAAGYLGIPLFVPILFRTTGPVAAGQVGMTMAVIGAAGSVAQSLIDAKVPKFCALIAAQQWQELDRNFFRRGLASAALFLLAIFGAVIAIDLLEFIGVHFRDRISPWPVFAIFSAAMFLNFIVGLEAAYLRWHRREPMMWVSVINGVLSAALSYFFAMRFGDMGVAMGFLCLTLLYALPAGSTIWITLRKRWHRPLLSEDGNRNAAVEPARG